MATLDRRALLHYPARKGHLLSRGTLFPGQQLDTLSPPRGSDPGTLLG